MGSERRVVQWVVPLFFFLLCWRGGLGIKNAEMQSLAAELAILKCHHHCEDTMGALQECASIERFYWDGEGGTYNFSYDKVTCKRKYFYEDVLRACDDWCSAEHSQLFGEGAYKCESFHQRPVPLTVDVKDKFYIFRCKAQEEPPKDMKWVYTTLLLVLLVLSVYGNVLVTTVRHYAQFIPIPRIEKEKKKKKEKEVEKEPVAKVDDAPPEAVADGAIDFIPAPAPPPPTQKPPPQKPPPQKPPPQKPPTQKPPPKAASVKDPPSNQDMSEYGATTTASVKSEAIAIAQAPEFWFKDETKEESKSEKCQVSTGGSEKLEDKPPPSVQANANSEKSSSSSSSSVSASKRTQMETEMASTYKEPSSVKSAIQTSEMSATEKTNV